MQEDDKKVNILGWMVPGKKQTRSWDQMQPVPSTYCDHPQDKPAVVCKLHSNSAFLSQLYLGQLGLFPGTHVP